MSTYQLAAFADEADKALSGQFAAMRANNVYRLEARGVNGKSIAALTDDEARSLKREMEDNGVSLSSMGSPYGKYPIEADFQPHLDAFKRGLDICHIIGASRMRMFSFFAPKSGDPASVRGEVIDRLGAMLDLADDAGVKLYHENECGIYGDVDTRCLDLMETLGDRLGCVFDPANFIHSGVKPYDAFLKLKPYISYMHIKDALMEGGQVVPAGKGDGALAAILDQLSDKADGMILTLEPHLKVFDGLSALQDAKLDNLYNYPDSRASFKAAADGLKDVLTGIGYTEVAGGKGIWKR